MPGHLWSQAVQFSSIDKNILSKPLDVASDVGDYFKKYGVYLFYDRFFHVFRYSFLQILHHFKSMYLNFTFERKKIKFINKSKKYYLHIKQITSIFACRDVT